MYILLSSSSLKMHCTSLKYSHFIYTLQYYLYRFFCTKVNQGRYYSFRAGNYFMQNENSGTFIQYRNSLIENANKFCF